MTGRDIIRDITEFIFLEHPPHEADIICIPGGSWPGPTERAARLYREGYAPYILPSGKYSVKLGRFAGVKESIDRYDGDYATEWDFMADVLRKNGVPDNAILKEDQSEYTQQNADFSRMVTDAMNLAVRRGILCCKAFHARRSLMYYAQAFPETDWIICPCVTKGIRREDWFYHEEATRTVLGELSRCGNQFGVEEIQTYARGMRGEAREG